MDSGVKLCTKCEPVEICTGAIRLGGYHLGLFLLRGAEYSVIFETGVAAVAPVMISQLDSLGIDREEVRYLILSHAHSDHSTGQEALMAGLPRAELVMTEKAASYLARPETAQDYLADEHFTHRALASSDYWPGLDSATPKKLHLLPQKPRIMEAGQVLDLGGLTLELMSARGHVPGGLLGWVPERKLMLASDSAGFPMLKRPNYPLFFTSYVDYLLTLKKISDLKPDYLALAHQALYRGLSVIDYLEDLAEHLESEHRYIMNWVVNGRKKADLVRKLMDRYYHDELSVYPINALVDGNEMLVKRSLEAA